MNVLLICGDNRPEYTALRKKLIAEGVTVNRVTGSSPLECHNIRHADVVVIFKGWLQDPVQSIAVDMALDQGKVVTKSAVFKEDFENIFDQIRTVNHTDLRQRFINYVNRMFSKSDKIITKTFKISKA